MNYWCGQNDVSDLCLHCPMWNECDKAQSKNVSITIDKDGQNENDLH